MKVEIRPLTPDRWHDIDRTFVYCDTCEGCWCMHWRLRNKDFLMRGIVKKLLKASIKHAGAHGAETLEAFPKDSTGKASNALVYPGMVNLFQEFNFIEVHRSHPKRPIMRYEIT